MSFIRFLLLFAGIYGATQEVSENMVFPSFGTNVYVVPEFLPHELAVEWRNAMKQTWENTRARNDTCPDKQWLYATNNPGVLLRASSRDKKNANNRKFRSLKNVAERNITANKMREAGLFSYAKWELDPKHELVEEVEDFLVQQEIRKKVEDVVQQQDGPKADLLPQLSDLLLTLYAPGDFLSPHDDGNVGTWTFVVSLMDGIDEWRPGFGGGLHFECPASDDYNGSDNKDVKWCEAVYPKFNTAVIFRSRSMQQRGPRHFVEPVSTSQNTDHYRFAITGWYMDSNDEMPDHNKQQQILIRARD